MKHIKTLNRESLNQKNIKSDCSKCKSACQPACRTSCTVSGHKDTDNK